MSTTTLEIMMQQEEFRANLDYYVKQIHNTFFTPLMGLIYKRTFLQRPHTDDMFQMLDDLGIDWPTKQPISYDGLTFRWTND